MLIGSTIGSGIFRTPAVVANRVDDVPLFLLAWVLGGVVAVCGALTYAELAAAFPRSGGIYVFLREGFGPLPAFLFGWAELLIIRPGAYGAISITAAAYALRVFGLDPAAPVAGLPVRGEQLLGAGLIILVAVVNYQGIRKGAVLQNLSTIFKVGALAVLVILGFALGGAGNGGWSGLLAQRAAVGLSPFLLAMVSILWAYDGWADLAFVGGEVRDPQRNLPRALFIGTGAVVVLYLAANLVYVYLIPIGQMKHAELVAADAASLLIGSLRHRGDLGSGGGQHLRHPQRLDDDRAPDLLCHGGRWALSPRYRTGRPPQRGPHRGDSARRDPRRDLRADPHLYRAGRSVHHRHLAVLCHGGGVGLHLAAYPS